MIVTNCFLLIAQYSTGVNIPHYQGFIDWMDPEELEELIDRLSRAGRYLARISRQPMLVKMENLLTLDINVADISVTPFSFSGSDALNRFLENPGLVDVPFFPDNRSYVRVATTMSYLLMYSSGDPGVVYPLMFLNLQFLLNAEDCACHIQYRSLSCK